MSPMAQRIRFEGDIRTATFRLERGYDPRFDRSADLASYELN